MSASVMLCAGPLQAVVDPAAGGRIMAFRREGVDLFTPLEVGSWDPASLVSGGSYPLVPWSNRIRDGELQHGSDLLRLPASEPGHRHAIHGHGWRHPWHCERGGNAVVLTFEHRAGAEGWPWNYMSRQRVSLTDRHLEIVLSVSNQSATGMPVGLGLHPYFPMRSGTLVQFAVETAWPPVEDEKFPTGGVAVPADLDRRIAGPVPVGLDQGFGGWDGKARIEWPEVGVGLTLTASDPLTHLIVYTPADRGYFCLEPVSHAIDATNLASCGRQGTGHRVLRPGETLSVTVTFEVTVL